MLNNFSLVCELLPLCELPSLYLSHEQVLSSRASIFKHQLQFQLFVFYFRWEVVLKTFKVLYFYQIFWPNNLYIIKYTSFCLLLRGFRLDLLEHYASYKWINALINNSKLPATIKKSSHSSAISWLRLPILCFFWVRSTT